MRKKEERKRHLRELLLQRRPGRHFLFEVEDVFTIKSRGVVLLPGWDGRVLLVIGDILELTRPDGISIETEVRGIESGIMGKGTPPAEYSLGLLVGPNVQKPDVPAGTAVALIVDTSEAAVDAILRRNDGEAGWSKKARAAAGRTRARVRPLSGPLSRPPPGEEAPEKREARIPEA